MVRSTGQGPVCAESEVRGATSDCPAPKTRRRRMDDTDVILTVTELDDLLADPRLSPAQFEELVAMRHDLEDMVEDTDARMLQPVHGGLN